jgi:hypothetical protein
MTTAVERTDTSRCFAADAAGREIDLHQGASKENGPPQAISGGFAEVRIVT